MWKSVKKLRNSSINRKMNKGKFDNSVDKPKTQKNAHWTLFRRVHFASTQTEWSFDAKILPGAISLDGALIKSVLHAFYLHAQIHFIPVLKCVFNSFIMLVQNALDLCSEILNFYLFFVLILMFTERLRKRSFFNLLISLFT